MEESDYRRPISLPADRDAWTRETQDAVEDGTVFYKIEKEDPALKKRGLVGETMIRLRGVVEPFTVSGRMRSGMGWALFFPGLMVICLVSALVFYGVPLRDFKDEEVQKSPTVIRTTGAGKMAEYSERTPIIDSMFDLEADPCVSIGQYAAGKWDGRGYTRAPAFGYSFVKAQERKQAVLTEMVFSGRRETRSFHDAVMSCVYDGYHPSENSDEGFAREVVDSLTPPPAPAGLTEGEADVYRGAWSLGRSMGEGVNGILSAKVSFDYSHLMNTVLKLTGDGTLLDEFGVLDETMLRDSFSQGCWVLMYLEKLPMDVFSGPQSCRDVLYPLFMDLVFAKADKARPEPDHYISSGAFTEDFYSPAELAEVVGPRGAALHRGLAEGLLASYSEYEEFLHERHYALPQFAQMTSWVRSPQFLQAVADKIATTEPKVWRTFVNALAMMDGLRFTTAILYEYPGGPGDDSEDDDGGSTPDEVPTRLAPTVTRGLPDPKPAIGRAAVENIGEVGTRVPVGERPAAPRGHYSNMSELVSSVLWNRCMEMTLQHFPLEADIATARTTLCIGPPGANRVMEMATKVNLKLGGKNRNFFLGYVPPTPIRDLPSGVDAMHSWLRNAFAMRRRNLHREALEVTNKLNMPSTMSVPAYSPVIHLDKYFGDLHVPAAAMAPPFWSTEWSDIHKHAVLGALIGATIAEGEAGQSLPSAEKTRRGVEVTDPGHLRQVEAMARGLQAALDVLIEERGADLSASEYKEFIFAFVQIMEEYSTKEEELEDVREDAAAPASVLQEVPVRRLRDRQGNSVMQRVFQCPAENNFPSP